MSEPGSSYGAYKVLRRRCTQLCVFVLYFCHKEGPTDFATIHTIFGASNASKLLAHLPINDRYGAAATLLYEAQGIEQVSVDGDKETLTVVVKVDAVKLTKQVRKNGKAAKMISVGPPKPKSPKPLPSYCHCTECQLVAIAIDHDGGPSSAIL